MPARLRNTRTIAFDHDFRPTDGFPVVSDFPRLSTLTVRFRTAIAFTRPKPCSLTATLEYVKLILDRFSLTFEHTPDIHLPIAGASLKKYVLRAQYPYLTWPKMRFMDDATTFFGPLLRSITAISLILMPPDRPLVSSATDWPGSIPLERNLHVFAEWVAIAVFRNPTVIINIVEPAAIRYWLNGHDDDEDIKDPASHLRTAILGELKRRIAHKLRVAPRDDSVNPLLQRSMERTHFVTWEKDLKQGDCEGELSREEVWEWRVFEKRGLDSMCVKSSRLSHDMANERPSDRS